QALVRDCWHRKHAGRDIRVSIGKVAVWAAGALPIDAGRCRAACGLYGAYRLDPSSRSHVKPGAFAYRSSTNRDVGGIPTCLPASIPSLDRSLGFTFQLGEYDR